MQAATLFGVVVAGATWVLGVAITIWGVYRCLGSRLGIGELLLLSSMAAGLSRSLLALSGTWLGFGALAAQFKRMKELLAAASVERRPKVPAPVTEDELVVDGVWFRRRQVQTKLENE